ncbi:MAG: hypothetical protein MJ236_00925 [Clostridia bacterium]|nr:hypothetical protein [Clostridia bacterium]
MINLKRILAFVLVFICIFSISCSKKPSDETYTLENQVVYSDSNVEVTFLKTDTSRSMTNFIFKYVNKTNEDLTFELESLVFNSYISALGHEIRVLKNSEFQAEVPVFVEDIFAKHIGEHIDQFKCKLSVYTETEEDGWTNMDYIIDEVPIEIYPTGLNKDTYVAPGHPVFENGKVLINNSDYYLCFVQKEYEEYFDGETYTFYFENNSNSYVEPRLSNIKVDGVEIDPAGSDTMEAGIRGMVQLLIVSEEVDGVDVHNIKNLTFTFELIEYNEEWDEVILFSQDCTLTQD